MFVCVSWIASDFDKFSVLKIAIYCWIQLVSGIYNLATKLETDTMRSVNFDGNNDVSSVDRRIAYAQSIYLNL